MKIYTYEMLIYSICQKRKQTHAMDVRHDDGLTDLVKIRHLIFFIWGF